MESNQIFVQYGTRPREMVKHLLDRGGIGPKLDPGASYALKPNLVAAKTAATGATTSPEIAAGVIEYLADCGCGNISIMESSWVGEQTDRAFETCGYTELARRYGVPLIDLKQDRTVTAASGGMELEICKSAAESDFLINIPVLKGHCQVRMTCALKNLKGCIPDSEKRRYHTLGLHEPIARLNTVLKPELIVVDALNGDLDFEEGGNPVPMDMMFLAEDPVLTDTFAASLMGLDAESIPYIRTAAELKAGCMDLDSARIFEAGTRPERKERKAKGRGTEVRRLAELIDERGACSACYGGLIHALYRMEARGSAVPRSGKLRIGQGFKGKSTAGIGIGSCTGGFEVHCPGCPPRASAIRSFLESLG